ncbi:MAG TPA: hypothetical protein PLR25_00065 [Planctomycetaceae bacterium]|nr:hypothetical protein [Planctomycetaceae bacterium]
MQNKPRQPFQLAEVQWQRAEAQMAQIEMTAALLATGVDPSLGFGVAVIGLAAGLCHILFPAFTSMGSDDRRTHALMRCNSESFSTSLWSVILAAADLLT